MDIHYYVYMYTTRYPYIECVMGNDSYHNALLPCVAINTSYKLNNRVKTVVAKLDLLIGCT